MIRIRKLNVIFGETIMDINTNIVNYYSKQKMPKDFRIVIGINYSIGLFTLLIGVLLLTSIAYFKDNKITVLFGTVTLHTKLSCALSEITYGFLRLLSSKGIGKRYKLAWWALLILSLDDLISYFFSYSLEQFNAVMLLWIFINIAMIVWLFLRRSLFVNRVIFIRDAGR